MGSNVSLVYGHLTRYCTILMNENVKTKAEELLNGFKEGNLSDADIQLIRNWLASKPSEKRSADFSTEEKNELLARINSEIDKNRVVKFRNRIWQYGSVAAVLLAALGISVYLNNSNPNLPTAEFVQTAQINDVLPGKDDAVVYLSNGSTLELNPETDSLATLDGVKINLSSGIISFEGLVPTDDDMAKPDENIIKTKNGGQYTVILPDGSLVKLNANSSLSFGNNFKENRFAKISGEVYFEVKKDTQHPFVVEAGHQKIQVLGTKFNVKSYPDEQTTTTSLMDGSLMVRPLYDMKGKNTYILKPGQTAKNGAKLTMSVFQTVPAKEMAWTDGSFHFDGETVEEVLTVLARWYDVQIKYEYTPNNDMRFGGVISRDKKLSSVLSLLEDQTGLKFVIRGKEVIVQK